MPEEKKIKRILKVGLDEASSLSSFVERPVPTEKEVATFERVVGREVREQEIDSNFSEIYLDKKGGQVDVQKMNIKKRPIFIVRLFKRLLILALIAVAAYFVYTYWFSSSNDVSGLDFKISAPENILAGEEFFYQVTYQNPTKYILSHARLEIQYPANFVLTAASVAPSSGNYGWDLPDISPGAVNSLTITGRLIGQPDSVNVIVGYLSYLPGTLSSQFKKETSASTIVSGLGFNVDLSYSSTGFINQDNEIILVLSDVKENYLGDFNIAFTLPVEANASVVTAGASKATTTPISAGTSTKIIVTKTGGASWQVSNLLQVSGRQEIPLAYKVKQKSDNLEIKVRLEKKIESGEAYVFWEKSFKPELVSSDLNLTMILNGSKNDGALTFGQPLHYSLAYSNRGAVAYKDAVIMAVLNSDFLNWSSLVDEKKGEVGDQTIIWTKNEVPELAEIKPGIEGTIDFSLNLSAFKDSDQGKALSVVSYGQYSLNNKAIKNDENKSNTITSLINSDLSLSEAILYFNSDNLPVGSGPLPPKVGERTSVKVYWTVKNNLHELTDARVVLTLPSYVAWDNNNTTNVGSIYYDSATHQVIWEIGRLPVSVYRADAEFGISLTPTESDRNRILVLSPGTTVSATDTTTKDTITWKTEAKTTKLEDDDIAGLSNSGRVE
ncbi:MAG: hypothetical protein NTY31_03770 [Candidatus Falkowbacteria bacterium]|nr:hypothetical protein [Candidatus Falkowbacteria bacterium]